ncbi:META domain-containing protein [Roseovarius pelagicus]|uniref:META domain-containing protein n=1 Tax=Roseovarius pelagicus TaxID=2980108 RepID=A0ABY6DHN9_9RHOB|nr:META domain-containing protein [Roseovarius pelagicus]UXX84478.1 META domain-containing protein [Roseovarius pelagicus]
MKELAAIIAALLSLNTCQKDETVTAYGGMGSWQLSKVSNTQVQQNIVLQLGAHGDVSVITPCTVMTARQIAPYPWFQLDDVREYSRNCPPTSVDTRAVSTIRRATLVEVVGDVLILSTDNDFDLEFSRRN